MTIHIRRGQTAYRLDKTRASKDGYTVSTKDRLVGNFPTLRSAIRAVDDDHKERSS